MSSNLYMPFVALDVETSNSNCATICQIGVVRFDKGKAETIFETLINPQESFSGRNIRVHGIRPTDVASSPAWKDIYPKLSKVLQNQIVAHHTHFDRTAVTQACQKNSLPLINCTWIDTSSVVRRAWPEVSKSGYGLADMAEKLGIVFDHHHATEDARAAGELFLKAINKSNIHVAEWVKEFGRKVA